MVGMNWRKNESKILFTGVTKEMEDCALGPKRETSRVKSSKQGLKWVRDQDKRGFKAILVRISNVKGVLCSWVL
jgi:hypothetical protein